MAEFLGEVRPDFWLSDRVGAQMGWAAKDHQACKALLKRAARIGRRRPHLADSALAVYQSRLQARLDDPLKSVPGTTAGQKLLRVIKHFRSEWGATLYANVRSVLETARRRSIAVLSAIKLTLQDTPLPTAASP